METQEPRVVNLTEADVKRVTTELEARPEAETSQVTPEAVRSALVAVLPKPQPSLNTNTSTAPLMPDDQLVAQSRIDSLVQMAVHDGIDAAHAAASNDEPYVLDALHDALAGAFYDQLQREGKL